MEQKFSGDVGQVAGRDVKSNAAQANVNIHVHNGSNPKYISQRQRSALARKVFQIQDKTGVEKLMVYRRLMGTFHFQSMDEMPRDVYDRAMRYLDGWLRNGTTEQVQSSPAQQETKGQTDAVRPAAPAAVPSAPAVAAPASSQPVASPASVQKTRFPLLAIVSTGVAVLALAAALHVEVDRHDAAAQNRAPEVPPHCEYGGSEYTVGSVVRQAGLRQRCEATSEHTAAWRPLASRGRH